ncbi:MAG: hypothetical protein WDN46_07460 [Methylocella sp.]
MSLAIDPLVAAGVLACTAVTDAAYVLFTAAAAARRRIWAANWSGIWYLLSAFAVISYTQNAAYVLFAAIGSWIGAFASVTWLRRGSSRSDGH